MAGKPKKTNVCSRMLWGIVSKAFCKLIKIIPVISLRTKPFIILSFRYEEHDLSKNQIDIFIMSYGRVWSCITFFYSFTVERKK